MSLDDRAQPRRLLIYSFSDAAGIVDRTVLHMLGEMKRLCPTVTVVCGGGIGPEGKAALEGLGARLLTQDAGSAADAYRFALTALGREAAARYEQVVLMDGSLIGPLYPPEDMFAEMDRRGAACWSIALPPAAMAAPSLADGIRSGFLALRGELLQRPAFDPLWKNAPDWTKIKPQAADFAVYIDTSDLAEYAEDPLLTMPDELIIRRKCPVMRLRSFSLPYAEVLEKSLGVSVRRAFDYIESSLAYDTDPVWEHLLRTENMAVLKNILHLNYILPDSAVLRPPRTDPARVALAMHLFYPEKVAECLQHAQSMPEGSDLLLTVISEETEREIRRHPALLRRFRQVRIRRVENRGRDISALLIGFAPYVDDYDLVCFVHDKKTTQFKPYTVGQGFAHKCLVNTLASPEYVQNILTVFEEHPRLGLLTPPPPNHASYCYTPGSEWISNYENTFALAQRLGLRCDIRPDMEPICPMGTMFWFRAQALKPLIARGWQYSDFPEEPNDVDGTLLHAFERIYGYAAQDRGYYSGWAMAARFAGAEFTNLYHMVRESNLHGGLYAQMAAAMRQPHVTPGRKRTKDLFRTLIPPFLWEGIKKGYSALGGKKWIGN